jgi:hypothetical protein
MLTTMEDTYERITAMRHQEDTGYTKCDWLQLAHCESANLPLHWNEAVDSDCRRKMVTWCVEVVDFCKFSHEIVEITMSLVDRFLATPEGTTARNDRGIYQLACMASLYTTIKINAPLAMSPKMVAHFSNGAFSSKDIEAMEVTLLNALKWRVNPPTSWDFVRMIVDLVPRHTVDGEMRKAALDLALFQTELAVANHQFVTVQASTIAYASIMNALESLGFGDNILGNLGYFLARSLEIDCDADHVVHVQGILYQLVAPGAFYKSVVQQQVDRPHAAGGQPLATTGSSDKTPERRLSRHKSPRSVSAAQL